MEDDFSFKRKFWCRKTFTWQTFCMCPPPMVINFLFIFFWWPSLKVVFHQRSSSIKGHLSSKVIFHQRSSSIKGRLTSKVIFHQRSSSIKGCLPSKVVSHQRLSYIKDCLSVSKPLRILELINQSIPVILSTIRQRVLYLHVDDCCYWPQVGQSSFNIISGPSASPLPERGGPLSRGGIFHWVMPPQWWGGRSRKEGDCLQWEGVALHTHQVTYHPPGSVGSSQYGILHFCNMLLLQDGGVRLAWDWRGKHPVLKTPYFKLSPPGLSWATSHLSRAP